MQTLCVDFHSLPNLNHSSQEISTLVTLDFKRVPEVVDFRSW